MAWALLLRQGKMQRVMPVAYGEGGMRLRDLLPRERMWNWTFWATIAAFEVLGIFLSGQP